MATGALSGGHAGFQASFTVSGFTLVDPNSGLCSSNASYQCANCGHIHETTDGTVCNGVDLPYNNFFVASPGDVYLDLCTDGETGAHTTILELHNNDHSLYTCSGACPNGIRAAIAYTAQ